MESSHGIKKKRRHASYQRARKHTHFTALAQAVIDIAKVNSKIAAISKQLQGLQLPKNHPKPVNHPIPKAQPKNDDDTVAEAISALLDAFDFDDLQVRVGDQSTTRRMQCPAELGERATKLQQLPRLGRLVRAILQERYPLSWELLLQS